MVHIWSVIGDQELPSIVVRVEGRFPLKTYSYTMYVFKTIRVMVEMKNQTHSECVWNPTPFETNPRTTNHLVVFFETIRKT